MSGLSRHNLARLVGGALPRDAFVNLGIGAPTMIADYLSDDAGVILHSENGILNVGPKPAEGAEDLDLINAGKMPITIADGGAFFDSSLSFAMMRGGHIDVAVLGAFEVSQFGDLANWNTGRDDGAPPAVGGAIDLAVGAKAIWVMMEQSTKNGTPRIVEACTLPLTANGVVSRIFTDLAVFEVSLDGLCLEAILDGLSIDDLRTLTGAPFTVGGDPKTISLDGSMA